MRTHINLANGLMRPKWLIGTKYLNKEFYVKEVNDDMEAVIWTSNRKNAISFQTEYSVDQYVYAYFKDRHDVYLIFTGNK